MAVKPLPEGTVLADRFELSYELGSGPFTIAYVATDRTRGDRCVVKELAPEGVKRDELGVIDLTQSGATAQHLRQRFHEEARRIGRLHLPAILPVRAAFNELGTAYFATDFIDGAISLERRILTDGPLPIAEVRRIMGHLVDTLAALHDKGVLHLNIKPANVLLAPAGRVFLVDFSSAREWYSDATVSHHLYFDSHYAAPEQLTDRLQRGPPTDVYGLCATLFHAITGAMPAHSESSENDSTPAISTYREDVPHDLTTAIESGLRIIYHHRPQSIAQLQDIAYAKPGQAVDPLGRVHQFDEIAGRLKRFKYEHRQCPSCKDVLAPPQLLRKGVCPVCHDGSITKRLLGEKFCPLCATGVLVVRPNRSPLSICPICSTGPLEIRRKKALSKDKVATCRQCDARFEIDGDQAKLVHPPSEEDEKAQVRTWTEWREISKRPESFLECDTCNAQFDRFRDGRLRQMWPTPTKYKLLYPDEWARVGLGLDLEAGNAECNSCRADFQVDGDSVTLLKAFRDPFGFAALHEGQLMKWEDLRWKGAGKESLNPGLICENCPTEFNFLQPDSASSPATSHPFLKGRKGDPHHLRLVRSDNPLLRALIWQERTIEDWHRIADGLPTIENLAAFEQDFKQALVEAYELGEISFEERDDEQVLWRGPALRLAEKREALEETGSGQLVISTKEVSFGGLLRKWRVAADSIRSASADGEVITLEVQGETTPVLFELTPVDLTVHLENGPRTVQLSALSLALRITRTARSAVLVG